MALTAHGVAGQLEDAPGGSPGGEPPTAPLQVPRASSEVVVDGVLDEDAWRDALVIPLAYEKFPGDNIPAPVRTEILVTFSSTHLLVGFRASDPTPGNIRAHFAERDNFREDENVAFKIDPHDDGQRALWFLVNPLGEQSDGITVGWNSDDLWDGLWTSGGRIEDWGYSVEISIPFTTLQPPPHRPGHAWGLEATRYYVEKGEHVLSSIRVDRNDDSLVSQLQKIAGIIPGEMENPLSVFPTFNGRSYSQGPAGEANAAETTSQLGGEAELRLTPSTNVTGTWKPDFSFVEPDAFLLDVNTPYVLQFPEKRPFFLVGSADPSLPLELLNTRAILEPEWGARLLSMSPAGSGMLFATRDLKTRVLHLGADRSSEEVLPEKNLSGILWGVRHLGDRITLGGGGTIREGSDFWSRMLGFNGDVRITESDRLAVLAARSFTEDPADFDEPSAGRHGDGWALSARVSHDARVFDGFLGMKYVEADFRADLGALQAIDYSCFEIGGSHTWYGTGDGFLAQSVTSIEGWRMDGLQSEYRWEMAKVTSTLSTRNLLGSETSLSYQREFREGTWLSHGGVDLSLTAIPTASFQVQARSTLGWRPDYLHNRVGSVLLMEGTLKLFLGRRFQALLVETREQMNVQDERLYTAAIHRLKGLFHFSSRAFLRLNLQVGDYQRNLALYAVPLPHRSRQTGVQLMASWRLTPRIYALAGFTYAKLPEELDGSRVVGKGIFLRFGYSWDLGFPGF